MTDLFFESKQELENFLSSKDRIGSGTEGICYRIDDYVLKIYNNLNNVYSDSYFLQFEI